MRHPDFIEGVKARLMSKPPRQAEWQPPKLENVSAEDVEKFFEIPDGESRLKLLSEGDYTRYPHERFALPREVDIEAFVRERRLGPKKTIEEFAKKWDQKEGVREKVAEVLNRRTISDNHGWRWV
ncbi:3-hydroxyisobutyryl-CoA hydrolase [Penicillium chermesinum]|nr:3-hydroxyisobutyryl-CoA hydrolase [Penicillium chermesinum]